MDRYQLNRKTIVTGDDLRELRNSFGFTLAQFALKFGLKGKNAWMTIQRYEKSDTLPNHIRLLAECFNQGARPSSWN